MQDHPGVPGFHLFILSQGLACLVHMKSDVISTLFASGLIFCFRGELVSDNVLDLSCVIQSPASCPSISAFGGVGTYTGKFVAQILRPVPAEPPPDPHPAPFIEPFCNCLGGAADTTGLITRALRR